MVNVAKVDYALLSQKLAPLYQAGATMREAALAVGCPIWICERALRRAGIARRGRSEARRVYRLDEGFFDRISNGTRAYWLGFISADGCIYRASVAVTVAACDVAHLHSLCKVLRSFAPVREITRSSRRYGRVVFYSQRLVQSLVRLGVGPRKSAVLAPCREIPPSLHRHYWRGLIDGDGWITRRASGKWALALSGTADICNGFRAYLACNFAISVKAHSQGAISVVEVGSRGALQRLLPHFYGDARDFLDRKRDLALSCMSGIEEQGKKKLPDV